jgi:hypothetical protein
MCRATNTIYDIAHLDVDTDVNASARIGSGSILHFRRWRSIALSNVHRELQSNVVPHSFVQEIHYELHAGRGFFRTNEYGFDTHRQVRYHPRGGRNRSERDCEYCVAKNASTSAHIIGLMGLTVVGHSFHERCRPPLLYCTSEGKCGLFFFLYLPKNDRAVF